MDPERWSRVRKILEEALDREPSERNDYLDSTCGDDDELRREVLELLREDECTHEDTDILAQSPTAKIFGEPAATSLVGQRIGDYRITRMIGVGGMGTVFEAEQDEPRRVVALKVMGQGLLSETSRRRFRYESEVLARLHHPGIAQVYAAGTHETQAQVTMPWFAMALVEGGKDLLQHADAENLSLQERVGLVIQVCDAVHYGHQRGVIHRDLKPSNILVDRQGRPTIIDFGIARATEAGDTGARSLQTKAGLVLGTLHYMSPEQLSGQTNAVDTRTDVYSLGVVCYQLLANQLPYDLENKTLPQASRLICEVEPKPIGQLDPQLRGDLSTIVQKAMAKEPDRRYGSAADLGRDLENYLQDRPILARPPSALYQLRKFTRRNRALAYSVVLILLLILGSAVTLAWQNIVVREAKAAAETETRRALGAVAFLTGVISEADALDFRGPDFTVREALEEAAARIDTELEGLPLIAADVHHVIGTTFRKMTLLKRADKHLLEALQTRRELLGNEHRQTLQTLRELAQLRYSQDLRQQALALAKEWQDTSMRVFGADDPDTLASFQVMGGFLKGEGQLEEAEASYRRALDGRTRVLGKHDEDTVQTRQSLGLLLWEQGRPEEARAELEAVLARRRTTLGPDHADTLITWDCLGQVMQDIGQVAEAEKIHTQTLQGLTRRLGKEHDNTLRAAASLIHCRLRLGKTDGLEQLATTTLASCRKVLGPKHRNTRLLARMLGGVRMQQGRTKEGVDLFQEAYDGTRAALGDNSAGTRRVASDLAFALQSVGKVKEALAVTTPLADNTTDIQKLDITHCLVLFSHGLAQVKMQQFPQAEKTLLRSRDIAVAKKSRQSQEALGTLRGLAMLYEAWGKPKQAQKYQKMWEDWGTPRTTEATGKKKDGR